MYKLSKISSYWWCQLGGWGLVALSSLFYAFSFRQEITAGYILKILIVMASGIISTHILRWVIKRYNWLMLPVEKVVVRLSIGVVCTSILFCLIVIGLNEAASLDANKYRLDFFSRLFGHILNFGIYIIPWALFYYFYHYIEKSRRQQLDTLKLESLVKELELKTIKSHINPHFIFNALNSIRALIDEDPKRARNAVTHLSNILRSSMQAEKLETVPLEKELNIVKDYLALEYIRFEDRLRIEYNIDEETLSMPVPPMMLQTLVENAIKHGVSKHMQGGVIRVISEFSNGHHELIVQNTGYLNGHAGHDGFGLSSTRNRLSLLYGDKAEFMIRQNKEMVEAKILMPK